jgi:hypothetical protein
MGKGVKMQAKDVISLVDLAERFAKAKGMGKVGYKWMRKAPGRSANKEKQVGNSLAVMKAVRAFNDSNNKKINVYSASGYDGSPAKVMVIDKSDVIRLKGFILRGGGMRKKSSRKSSPFKILGKVDV